MRGRNTGKNEARMRKKQKAGVVDGSRGKLGNKQTQQAANEAGKADGLVSSNLDEKK